MPRSYHWATTVVNSLCRCRSGDWAVLGHWWAVARPFSRCDFPLDSFPAAHIERRFQKETSPTRQCLSHGKDHQLEEAAFAVLEQGDRSSERQTQARKVPK